LTIRKSTHSDLIEDCRRGDARAHTRVYELYCKAMYNTAYRILDDEFLAEDIMQEAFISAFEKLPGFKGEVSFGAWLKRIVINKSINEAKQRQTTWNMVNEFPETEVNEETDIPVDSQTISRVYNALTKLPDGYRIILSLYLLEGYDHEEIGDILGITSSTSRSQYSRAKQRLKQEVLNSENNARGF